MAAGWPPVWAGVDWTLECRAGRPAARVGTVRHRARSRSGRCRPEFDHAYGPSRPPTGFLVTANERWRYAGSSPEPDRRFQYRFLAVQDAERAADAPTRSQAFAAVLCRATGWMFQSDDEAEAFRLYRRYTASGAIVPFATRFGYGCLAPNFGAAARLRWKQPIARPAPALHRHRRPAVGAAIVLAALLGTAALIRRRRHRA